MVETDRGVVGTDRGVVETDKGVVEEQVCREQALMQPLQEWFMKL